MMHAWRAAAWRHTCNEANGWKSITKRSTIHQLKWQTIFDKGDHFLLPKQVLLD